MPTLPPAVLLTNDKGAVTEQNEAAIDLLGKIEGPCWSVVRARDANDAPVCSSLCAMASFRQVVRDQASVSVRGRWVRLVCSPMGAQTAVQILPTDQAPEAPPPSSWRHDVMALVTQGVPTAEIASRLGVLPAEVIDEILVRYQVPLKNDLAWLEVVMGMQREDVAEILHRLRALTGSDELPNASTATWRALWLKIRSTPGDLREHIAAALAMEQKRLKATPPPRARTT